jgi:hypothetical protein
MARILIATVPVLGQVNPMLPTELVEGLLPETRRTPRPEGKARVVAERRDRQQQRRAKEALRSA